jgi:hypothetical protein
MNEPPDTLNVLLSDVVFQETLAKLAKCAILLFYPPPLQIVKHDSHMTHCKQRI